MNVNAKLDDELLSPGQLSKNANRGTFDKQASNCRNQNLTFIKIDAQNIYKDNYTENYNRTKIATSNQSIQLNSQYNQTGQINSQLNGRTFDRTLKNESSQNNHSIKERDENSQQQQEINCIRLKDQRESNLNLDELHLNEDNELDKELEIDYQVATGECITKVKITKLKDQLNENKLNLDELLDAFENEASSSFNSSNFKTNTSSINLTTQNLPSNYLLKRKIKKANLEDNLVLDNQQVNEYNNSSSSLDSIRFSNYSIIQMLNKVKSKSTSSIKQVNSEKATITSNLLNSTGKRSYTKKTNKKCLNKLCTEFYVKELLEELAIFNGSSCSASKDASRLDVVKKNVSREQASNTVEKVCCWVEKGGLKHTKNVRKKKKNDGSFNIYNLKSKRTSELQTAGKLKATVFKTVQIEPLFKHLDDENKNSNNNQYSSILNQHHHRNYFFKNCDKLCVTSNQLRNSQAVDQLDYNNNLVDQNLIKQTSDFITIIELDNQSKCQINVSDDDDCDLLLGDFQNAFQNDDNQFVNINLDVKSNELSSDQLSDLIYLSNLDKLDNKMYALSGVHLPNGLKVNQTANPTTTATSTQYLPALVATNQLLQHSSSMPSINTQQQLISTSVVPVIVSSTSSINSTIHQPILNQNIHFITEKVQIYREKGERIGMALNFNEANTISEQNNIERVFIQTVNPNSPASRATGERLGSLKENDELLCIENRPVNTMSRLDCVECLRDAGQCINLLVRGARVDGISLTRTSTTFETTTTNNSSSSICTGKRPPKIPLRNSSTVLTSVINQPAAPLKDNLHQNSSVHKLNNNQMQLNNKNCDLNSSDKLNANNNNLKNSSSSTNTLKVLRRPVVAPPLPPRGAKISDDNSSSLLKQLNESNELNGLSSNSNSELSSKIEDSNKVNQTKLDSSNAATNELATNVPVNSELNSSIVLKEESTDLNARSNCLNDVKLSKQLIDKNEENNLEDLKDLFNNESTEQRLNSINKAPKQLDLLNENNDKCLLVENSLCVRIDETLNKTINNDEQQPNTVVAIIKNQNLNSSYPTSIQHQSTKNTTAATISYANNIATSTLQLMNGLNSINSPFNHFDFINQQNVCIILFLTNPLLA